MSGYWPDGGNVSALFKNSIASGPPSGFAENFDAQIENQMLLNNSTSKYINLTDAYGARADEIYRLSGQRLDNPILEGEQEANTMPAVPRDQIMRGRIGHFEDEADRLRAQYPQITTQAQMWQGIHDQAQAVEADTADTDSRATLTGKIGGFAGQMGGSLQDPLNLLTLPFGATKTAGILKTALQEAGAGALSESLIQPDVQEFRKEAGLDYGAGQAAENIAMSAGGRAAVGVAAKTIAPVLGLAGKKLLSAFDRDVPNPTPEQAMARDMYGRITEINDDSPFDHNDPDAVVEHNQRAAAAIRAVQTGAPPDMPETPAAPLSEAALSPEKDNLDGLLWKFDPSSIQTDAKTFQFKEGGDEGGVTDRLRGVSEWDPVKAGQVIVYEDEAGNRFIADGHQRLGLAQRLQDANPDAGVSLYGALLREVDGYTPEQVRVIAAMKNIAEGTGTAIDAAKVLRTEPGRVGELPPSSTLVRQARDMVNLSDNAFGMVVNDIVPSNYAAIVGRLIPRDGAAQEAVMNVLAKTEPANAVQAESIARQAIEAGFHTETTGSLFGDETTTNSLFSERAKVLDKTLKKLRQDAKVFDTLVSNADSIASEGNVLSTDANTARARTDARAAQMIQTLATRRGPLSDALTAAARRAADEGRYANATADFAGAVRRAIEAGDFDWLSPGGAGSADEIAAENAARPHAAAEAGPDDRTLALFSEPGGQGAELQGRALEADLRRETGVSPENPEQAEIPGAAHHADAALLDMKIPAGLKVDPETGEVTAHAQTVREALDGIERDRADLEAIGRCGKP
jgi:hypothetical protein